MNIPPKSIKSRIARNAPVAGNTGAGGNDSNGKAPTPGNTGMPSTIRTPTDLADMENVSSESLPVLQAFQDFLEAERKHSRRQLAAVTAFFLILFIIVAGAGAFFGYVYVGNLNNRIAAMHGEIGRTKAALNENASEMFTDLAARTENLSTRIVDGDQLIRQATTQISSTVSKSLSGNLAEIEKIRNEIKALREENINLRHSIARIRTVPQTVVTSGIDTSIANNTSSVPMAQPAPVATADVKIPKTNRNSTLALAPLEMAILAPGSSKTIKWRIPISE